MRPALVTANPAANTRATPSRVMASSSICEQVFVSRGERVAEADHLKTIAVADKPDLHLAARFRDRALNRAHSRRAGSFLNVCVAGSIVIPAASSAVTPRNGSTPSGPKITPLLVS